MHLTPIAYVEIGQAKSIFWNFLDILKKITNLFNYDFPLLNYTVSYFMGKH
jgi:hypothetical protein